MYPIPYLLRRFELFKMHCYCANYYGSVHCQNKVSHFGQRCRLCTVMNEGTPAKEDLFKTAASNYYAEDDSDNTHEDDSSREETRRGRTMKRSKSS
ncbi:hypothetical protein F4804DRAFT_322386 [Jackrogersella minutella]|nr:hypothetical protein F4804DRAFT_322386 [Jackrogersella minutella]